jgi:hypothetical protein
MLIVQDPFIQMLLICQVNRTGSFHPPASCSSVGISSIFLLVPGVISKKNRIRFKHPDPDQKS